MAYWYMYVIDVWVPFLLVCISDLITPLLDNWASIMLCQLCPMPPLVRGLVPSGWMMSSVLATSPALTNVSSRDGD